MKKTQASIEWKEAMTKRQKIYVDAKVSRWKRVQDELKGTPFTVFEVNVKTNAAYMFENRTEFSVSHRYTDFLKLSKDMLVYLRPIGAPTPFMPPRGYTNRFSGAILEERRQAFEALLTFWIDMFDDVNRIGLPLLDFLKPGSSFEVDNPLIPNQYPAGNIVDISNVKLPPLLRFQKGSGFPDRLRALNMWLTTRTPQELFDVMTCYYVTRLIEAVGGFCVNHKIEVAKMLAPCVNDPHRMFLIFEMFPEENRAEVATVLNKQPAA